MNSFAERTPWSMRSGWVFLLTALGCFLPAADSCWAASPSEAKYEDFAALRLRLEQIAESDLARLSSLGVTSGGRDVLMLTIGQGDPANKPGWLVLGSVRATDLAAGELAVQIVEQLLAQANEKQASGKPGDAKARAEQLLKQVTLYVIPRPSPDASERYFAQPRHASALNSRPTDEDRDGETDEDPTDDLDKNGLITLMRVESPVGTWITHPEEARVLIEADPKRNERGKYLLFSEGLDNDGDGKWNEDGPGGVDFNSNYTFEYPYFAAGAGPNQVSEPETRAVADFAFNHPNLAAVLSFSPQDNIHHPWKPNSSAENSKFKTTLLSADATYQDKLVGVFQKALSQRDAPPTAKADGAFAPWAYFHFGRWSLSTPPWWVPTVTSKQLAEAVAKRNGKQPEKQETAKEEKKGGKDSRGAEQVNALRWLELEQIEGFVPWREIEHPDFPGQKVEIGGFHPYILQNPPLRVLEGLAERHIAAWAEALELSPQVVLAEVKCESVGAGLFRLTVVARNDGFLPTMSAQGKASKLLQDLQVELALPDGVELYEGYLRGKLPVLAGQGGHARRSWVLLADEKVAGTIGVSVGSPAVGTTSARVELPRVAKPAK